MDTWSEKDNFPFIYLNTIEYCERCRLEIGTFLHIPGFEFIDVSYVNKNIFMQIYLMYISIKYVYLIKYIYSSVNGKARKIFKIEQLE